MGAADQGSTIRCYASADQLENSLNSFAAREGSGKMSSAEDEAAIEKTPELVEMMLGIEKLMSSEEDEAIEKFKKTPELVEMLLPFLNAAQILLIARLKLLNIQHPRGVLCLEQTDQENRPIGSEPCGNGLDGVDRFYQQEKR